MGLKTNLNATTKVEMAVRVKPTTRRVVPGSRHIPIDTERSRLCRTKAKQYLGQCRGFWWSGQNYRVRSKGQHLFFKQRQKVGAEARLKASIRPYLLSDQGDFLQAMHMAHPICTPR